MTSKSRINKVGAALRRQRHANGRTVIRYEGGPCWFNGQVVEPLENDLIVNIVYQAKATDPNVRQLTWGDDTLTTE